MGVTSHPKALPSPPALSGCPPCPGSVGLPQRRCRSMMGRAPPVDRSVWMTLFRSLESAVATNKGRARFVVRATLLAFVPSVLMFGVLVALGVETMRAPTGALDPAFIAYSVLLAPMIETAVMLAIAVLLVRLAPGHLALQIALVALITALAHRIGSDWRHVVDTAWPAFVYAMTLVLWLRRSATDAFIVTAIVHALYNAAFFAVGILGPLALGQTGRSLAPG